VFDFTVRESVNSLGALKDLHKKCAIPKNMAIRYSNYTREI
jgi:hypothetical protein